MGSLIGDVGRFAAIVASAEDAILSKSLDGTIETWNPAAERIYGYAAQEAIGRSVRMLVPADRPTEVDDILARLAAGQRVEPFETKRVRKDGVVIDVAVTMSPVYSPEGIVVGGATIARDITASNVAARHLRVLAAIVEGSQDAIIARDPEGVVLTWNPASERLFGYSAEEIVGTDRFLATPAGDAASRPDELTRRQEAALRGERPPPLEVTLWHKDGSTFPGSVAFSPVLDEKGAVVAVAGIIRDLTELRSLEDQLRQSQKLEAIGSLAGSIAHDFNNLLTVIRANADLALARDDVRSVREIATAAELAGALTGQLLAFSRQQVLRLELLELNAVIDETVTMLGRIVGEEIELRCTLGEAPGILADRAQLQQVVLNLVVNARDAMPGGGKIFVRTDRFVVDAGYAATHLDLPPGEYAMLEVTDTGHGMNAETRRRIFEPFFTTKETGTGLGLPTVYGVVRQLGGQIFVYSEIGTGTSFKVYIPANETDAPPRPTRLEPAPETLEGRETVLVVEDTEILRLLVNDLLADRGYRVILASNGAEAIQLARDASIDLLLTDVVMPEMNGRQLAGELRERRPGLSIVFTSGYPADISLTDWLADERVTFLQKPYGLVDLLHTVRAALDRVQEP